MNILITLPHSSTEIPDKYVSQFSASSDQLMTHCDYAVDKFANSDSCMVLSFPVSRFLVDVNRKRDDWYSPQGVIVNEDWDGSQILAKPLTDQQIEERLKEYYDPFYEEFEKILSSYGSLFVFDCHAMSSGEIKYKDVPGKNINPRPDICLGTDNETSCSKEILQIIKSTFEDCGYEVGIDYPYKAAKANMSSTVKKYNHQVVQIEFNKALYMDEKTYALDNEKIDELKKAFSLCVEKVKAYNE